MTRTQATLFAFLLVLLAQASGMCEGCDLQSIKGTFGFVSSVRLRVLSPDSTKHTETARFIGLISYDGNGGATAGGITVAPNSKAAPYTTSGTYKIDAARCTGSVSFQNGSEWLFVVVENGDEMLTVVGTSPNTTPFSQKRRR